MTDNQKNRINRNLRNACQIMEKANEQLKSGYSRAASETVNNQRNRIWGILDVLDVFDIEYKYDADGVPQIMLDESTTTD